jgi:hypothetical protein
VDVNVEHRLPTENTTGTIASIMLITLTVVGWWALPISLLMPQALTTSTYFRTMQPAALKVADLRLKTYRVAHGAQLLLHAVTNTGAAVPQLKHALRALGAPACCMMPGKLPLNQQLLAEDVNP